MSPKCVDCFLRCICEPCILQSYIHCTAIYGPWIEYIAFAQELFTWRQYWLWEHRILIGHQGTSYWKDLSRVPVIWIPWIWSSFQGLLTRRVIGLKHPELSCFCFRFKLVEPRFNSCVILSEVSFRILEKHFVVCTILCLDSIATASDYAMFVVTVKRICTSASSV